MERKRSSANKKRRLSVESESARRTKLKRSGKERVKVAEKKREVVEEVESSESSDSESEVGVVVEKGGREEEECASAEESDEITNRIDNVKRKMSSYEEESSDEEDEALTLFKKPERNQQKSRKRVEKNSDLERTEKEVEKKELIESKVPEEWSFEALGLSPWLVETCKRLGMLEPTPVQMNCIPPTLRGCNLVGSAPTGSGKTAAFALPILQSLAEDMYGVFAVVLTPTRELAFQIHDQFHALGTSLRLRCEVIVGGLPLIQQQKALASRPHVIVATPGRFSEHLLGPMPPKLSRTRFVVLDEADQLLDPTFAGDLKRLFAATPPSRQTLLYSATMTNALERAKTASQKEVFEYHANKKPTTPGALDERYLLIPQQVKSAYLAYALRRLGPEFTEGPLAPGSKLLKKRDRLNKILEARGIVPSNKQDEGNSEDEDGEENPFHFERAKSVIIFTSSCKRCQQIGAMLGVMKVDVSVLNGKMPQAKRMAAIGKFRQRVTNILVATDVASRGLDIPQVDLVINFDVPKTPEDYIHRVGRTARAGRQGLALTFITQYEIQLIKNIEAVTNVKLQLLPGVDEENDVHLLLTRVANAERAARMELIRNEDRHF